MLMLSVPKQCPKAGHSDFRALGLCIFTFIGHQYFFLQAVNVNCLQMTLDCLFISRKGRQGRRDLFPFLFHACAGVVANFVTIRVRREFYPPTPPCGGLFSKKPLHPPLRAAGRGNPRIVKARSSHGISREHEWAGAWQYVSISRAMWERKRYGYLHVLSCLQGAYKCVEYQ